MDLHIHSTCSDGALSPVELVKKFHNDEYSIIAITDHDTVDGVSAAQIAGEALEIQVISGIELGTIFDDEIRLHILGYYIDTENKELGEAIEALKKARKERNEAILSILNRDGYDISENDLKVFTGQKYIGKPHFALALKNRVARPARPRAASAFGLPSAPPARPAARPGGYDRFRYQGRTTVSKRWRAEPMAMCMSRYW